jgi:hypothetical protein
MSSAERRISHDSPVPSEEFPMKEFICFAIGLVVGAVIMKKSQALDELKKELDREKFCNRPSSRNEPA